MLTTCNITGNSTLLRVVTKILRAFYSIYNAILDNDHTNKIMKSSKDNDKSVYKINRCNQKYFNNPL